MGNKVSDPMIITPQVISILSPKLEKASLAVEKDIYKAGEKAPRGSRYQFNNIDLHLKPRYLRARNWNDRMLEHMYVAASGIFFYTTGGP